MLSESIHRRTTVRLLLLAALLSTTGLGGAPALSAQAAPREITVSAAASLSQAFTAAGQAFERSHPGTRVFFNFAASGALLAQLRQGAPVDVFASADRATMDRAAQAGLVAAPTRVDFARNSLVLVVPARSATLPRSLSDLAGPAWSRIAIGTPSSVPVGAYAQAAVDAAGLSAVLGPRWIRGESVRQVLSYVVRGEVDAGFVYRSDAMLEADRVRIAFTVPTVTPVSYPIAVTAGSRNAALAGEFIAQLRSPAGVGLLARFGLEAP
ncbi:MAG: molybdate ABC transporter substrate-binding protein [Comamonadaceae bacterium]|nr:MAG: molybdate ABC transporter substrate-binding protein [Comamonadaceae bacterium]